MAMNTVYAAVEPTRDEVDRFQGPLVLEFGAPWCGYCAAVQPKLEVALASYPNMPHLKIEDGPGRRLGRSFRVKLWPTLVFMQDGRETTRLVRPSDSESISEALAQMAASSIVPQES
jgi:thioredoxin 1